MPSSIILSMPSSNTSLKSMITASLMGDSGLVGVFRHYHERQRWRDYAKQEGRGEATRTRSSEGGGESTRNCSTDGETGSV